MLGYLWTTHIFESHLLWQICASSSSDSSPFSAASRCCRAKPILISCLVLQNMLMQCAIQCAAAWNSSWGLLLVSLFLYRVVISYWISKWIDWPGSPFLVTIWWMVPFLWLYSLLWDLLQRYRGHWWYWGVRAVQGYQQIRGNRIRVFMMRHDGRG